MKYSKAGPTALRPSKLDTPRSQDTGPLIVNDCVIVKGVTFVTQSLFRGKFVIFKVTGLHFFPDSFRHTILFRFFVIFLK